MEEIDPFIGETIAGYEIIDILGRGGMGVVYKARQISLDRIVAIKILPGQFSTDKEYIQRFQKEARAAARLNHHNIIQIYDFGLIGQLHYLAMEYIDGAPLSAYIKAYGRIQEEDCLRIILQACEALDCAHKSGIIHRDIKPDNILLSNAGDVKLCDLGLAKLTIGEDLSLTQTGMAVGTPYYISPEQVRGDKILDHRTDIYSLGATCYHLLTGRIPFDGPSSAVVMSRHLTDPLEDPRLIQPDLSYEITCVIYKMMAKSPDERYNHIGEAYHEIEKILNKPKIQEAPAPEAVEKFVVRKNQGQHSASPAHPEQIAPALLETHTEPSVSKVENSLPEQHDPGQSEQKTKIQFKQTPSTIKAAQQSPQKRTALPLVLSAIVLIVLIIAGVWVYLSSKNKQPNNESTPSIKAPDRKVETHSNPEPLPPTQSNNPPENPTSIPDPDDARTFNFRRILFATISPDPSQSNIPVISERSRVIFSVEKPNQQMYETVRKQMLDSGKRLTATLVIPLKIKGDQPVNISLYSLKKPIFIISNKIKQAMADGGIIKDGNRPGFLPGRIRENLSNAAETIQKTSWTSQSKDTPWELPGANGSSDRSLTPLATLNLSQSAPDGSISCDISDDFARYLSGKTDFLDYILITDSSNGAAGIALNPEARIFPKIQIE
ncbi:MAG: serine/threonine-protein kinase [Verrucomicrobiota bacterium]|nr:serine/threonine-protein kinase [Verrucomicrobiota bacterium]